MVNSDNTKVNFRFVSKEDTNEVKRTPPPPEAKEKFQKVLAKEGEKENPEEDKQQAVKEKKGDVVKDQNFAIDPDEPKKGGKLSLFDLSRGTAEVEPKVVKGQLGVEALPIKKEEKETGLFGLIETTKKSTDEQPEMQFGSYSQGSDASITPMAMIQNAPIETHAMSSTPVRSTAPLTNIQEIIDQIVDKATQTQYAGKTETTLTLKNSTLLNGAQVVITEFNSAKGEFNISFQGLTQAAKNVLDMNQNTLLQAFESKGFVVHILTTTTVVEQPIQQHGSNLTRGFGQKGEEQPNKEREKRDDTDTG